MIIAGGAQICGFKVHFLVCPLLILTLKRRKFISDAHNWRMVQDISARKTTFSRVTKGRKKSSFSKGLTLVVCTLSYKYTYFCVNYWSQIIETDGCARTSIKIVGVELDKGYYYYNYWFLHKKLSYMQVRDLDEVNICTLSRQNLYIYYIFIALYVCSGVDKKTGTPYNAQ